MRITSIKISILALAAVTMLAIAPIASATTIDLFVGTTQVATLNLTSGGTCPSGDVCVTYTGVGGNQVRTGGPTFGFSGTNLTSVGVTGYTGSGNIGLQPGNGSCGGMPASETLCFQITGQGANGTFSTLNLTLTGVTLGQITNAGIHVIGPVCGTDPATGGFATCFTTSSSVVTTPVPEPGTLGFLGTGLVGIAGLVRRRFRA